MTSKMREAPFELVLLPYSKAIGSLTNVQVRALAACLLWKAGGVDKNGVVQPLGNWL